MGETISNLLSKEFIKITKLINIKNIKNILSNIDGLGPKVVNSITEYFENNNNNRIILELIEILNIQQYKKPNLKNKFSGKSIVFTGK